MPALDIQKGEIVDPVDAQSDPTPHHAADIFIVVMGVSGTGKTTLGSGLAKALDMPYVEGDDLHPKSNVDKMTSGHPLTDADREPWLELIRTTAEDLTVKNQHQVNSHDTSAKSGGGGAGVVISCSALKRYYRDILRGRGRPASDVHAIPKHLEPLEPEMLQTYFVFIDGTRDVLLGRMEKRPGHFMKASMLDSQLATLESPIGEEGVIVVSLLDTTEEQIRIAREGLRGITLEDNSADTGL